MEKTMKKRVFFFVFLVLLLTLGSIPTASVEEAAFAQTKPISLNYATYLPGTFPPVQADKMLCEYVEKATKGTVTFRYNLAGSLLKAPDVIPGISKGMADLGLCPTAYNPEGIPLTRISYTCFHTDNPCAFMDAYARLMSAYPSLFEREYSNLGLNVLYSPPVTSMVLGTKVKVTKMEDLRGLKIRAVGDASRGINALGAASMPIAPVEIYDAMQKGVIDGYAVMDWSLVHSFRLAEVTPYFIDSGFGVYGAFLTSMNLNKWRALSEDIRKAFRDGAMAAPSKYMEIIMAAERLSLDDIKAAGGQMIRLSPQEKARWEQTAKPKLWEPWIQEGKAKGFPAQEMLSKFNKLCKDAERVSKYKSPFQVWEAEYLKK